mmetsp:Transcript_61718/g.108101  ORF Transcript_61718/g.108101 Transcript_61718/m.108101 type:complete len:204 (+) Transcript_61718:79-690(+)
MKLYSIIIYKWQEESQGGALEMQTAYELASFSFFQRPTIREHIKFHSRLACTRTPVGSRQKIEFDQNLGFCYTKVDPKGIGCAVLADAEYPQRAAFKLVDEALREFETAAHGKWEDATKDMDGLYPQLLEYLAKFQDPVQVDKLMKIEKDLDEVKGVLVQSMDGLMKRGEKIEDLMQKSKDLSKTSVNFYRTAKKNNQCCKAW